VCLAHPPVGKVGPDVANTRPSDLSAPRGWRATPGTPPRRRVRRPYADLALTRGLSVTHDSKAAFLEGEVTGESAKDLAELEAIDRPEGGLVLVDLSRVGFVDVRGVRALVRLRDRFDAKGIRLVLQEPSDTLLRVLTVMGVDPPVEVTWE
jgi:anti-anti-sigma factor